MWDCSIPRWFLAPISGLWAAIVALVLVLDRDPRVVSAVMLGATLWGAAVLLAGRCAANRRPRLIPLPIRNH